MIHLSILLEKFFGCEIRPVYVSFELDFTNEYLKAFRGADFGTLGGYFASFSPCLPDTEGGSGRRSQWDGNQPE